MNILLDTNRVNSNSEISEVNINYQLEKITNKFWRKGENVCKTFFRCKIRQTANSYICIVRPVNLVFDVRVRNELTDQRTSTVSLCDVFICHI